MERIDVAETAKLVRAALKRAFPGHKFGVRSERYSMGASIRIDWRDGPTSAEVDAVVGAYGGRCFDGMIDLAYDVSHWLMPDGSATLAENPGTSASRGSCPPSKHPAPGPGARLVRFACSRPSTSRSLSADALRTILREVVRYWGLADKVDAEAAEIIDGGFGAHLAQAVYSVRVDDRSHDTLGDLVRRASCDRSFYARPETPTPPAGRSAPSTPAAPEGPSAPAPLDGHSAPLRIEVYSDRSVIVRGETYQHRERIKSALVGLAPFFHRKASGWIFPTSRADDVRAALADLLAPGDGSSAPDQAEPEVERPAPAPRTFGPKLRAQADRLEAAADEAIGRDRLTNTRRRVNIAAGIIREAEGQKALARTMRAIADAQDAGTAGPLAAVSTRKHVEALNIAARRAMYAADRALARRYDPERQPSADDVAHAARSDDLAETFGRAGITRQNHAEALALFIALRSGRRPADPVKAAEMALVGVRIDGFFPTPPELARRMVAEAGLAPGMSVLEPSAGSGRIADAVAEAVGRDGLTLYEVAPRLADLLRLKGYSVAGGDCLDAGGRFDRVLMNPPFERGQDIDHVRHAFGMLAPGGRLVAIMSEGPFFRQDRKASEFRDWLDAVGGTSERLPADSFASSGTGAAARLVVIDAADPAPASRTLAPFPHGRPGDAAAVFAEEAGVDYGTALRMCNVD